MNDAATNTYFDGNLGGELLSFHMLNNSPTFENASKDDNFENWSFKKHNPKNIMAVDPLMNIGIGRNNEGGTSKTNSQARFGGGFKVSSKPSGRTTQDVPDLNNSLKTHANNYDANILKVTRKKQQMQGQQDYNKHVDDKLSSRDDTDLILESRMHHNISKLSHTKDICNDLDNDDHLHHVSMDEPQQPSSGYVALEGKSLLARELEDASSHRGRRVIKPIKNNPFRASESSEGTQRLCFTAGANYDGQSKNGQPKERSFVPSKLQNREGGVTDMSKTATSHFK